MRRASSCGQSDAILQAKESRNDTRTSRPPTHHFLVALLCSSCVSNRGARPDSKTPASHQLLASDLPGQFTRLVVPAPMGLDSAPSPRARANDARDTADSPARRYAPNSSPTSRMTLGNTLRSKRSTLRTASAAPTESRDQPLAQPPQRAPHRQSERLEILASSVEGSSAPELNRTECSQARRDAPNTVDEKLHATLQNRLTESFGQVTRPAHQGPRRPRRNDQAFRRLSTTLSRIFTNVKSRGGFASRSDAG